MRKPRPRHFNGAVHYGAVITVHTGLHLETLVPAARGPGKISGHNSKILIFTLNMFINLLSFIT
jgi:hypothetical protein